MIDRNRARRPAPALLVVVVVALLAAGCRAKVELPPITSPATGFHQTGKFVWFDLVTDDLAKVQPFYTSVFGWQIELVDDNGRYAVVRHAGRAIGGIIVSEGLNDEVNQARWLSSLSVENVDSAVEHVMQSGGVVHIEPKDIDERGRVAVVSDPQGAVLAFVRSSTGDPEEREPSTGDWLWNELWTSDVDRALEFYTALADYESRDVPAYEGIRYFVLDSNSLPRGGIGELRWDTVRPHWLPYLAIDDLAATLERVTSLGGSVILKPEDVRGGTVAIVADPSGAAFSVQVWPYDEEEKVE